jgi:hypothetical protein
LKPKPKTSPKCLRRSSIPIPFAAPPQGSNKLNSEIQDLEQRLKVINEDLVSHEQTIKSLTREQDLTEVYGTRPQQVYTLEKMISNKINQHVWKQIESLQIKRKLADLRQRAGFTRIE